MCPDIVAAAKPDKNNSSHIRVKQVFHKTLVELDLVLGGGSGRWDVGGEALGVGGCVERWGPQDGLLDQGEVAMCGMIRPITPTESLPYAKWQHYTDVAIECNQGTPWDTLMEIQPLRNTEEAIDLHGYSKRHQLPTGQI